jgi:hypothetical protein
MRANGVPGRPDNGVRNALVIDSPGAIEIHGRLLSKYILSSKPYAGMKAEGAVKTGGVEESRGRRWNNPRKSESAAGVTLPLSLNLHQ